MNIKQSWINLSDKVKPYLKIPVYLKAYVLVVPLFITGVIALQMYDNKKQNDFSDKYRAEHNLGPKHEVNELSKEMFSYVTTTYDTVFLLPFKFVKRIDTLKNVISTWKGSVEEIVREYMSDDYIIRDTVSFILTLDYQDILLTTKSHGFSSRNSLSINDRAMFKKKNSYAHYSDVNSVIKYLNQNQNQVKEFFRTHYSNLSK